MLTDAFYYDSLITTDNFDDGNPCDGRVLAAYAVVCRVRNGNTITGRPTYFNISRTFVRWKTSGTRNEAARPREVLVYEVILHELGHWGFLYDFPTQPPQYAPNSVMSIWRTDLHEDDKQGFTQLYGPWTGWEYREATGEENRIDFWRKDVVGYLGNNTPPPALERRITEMGVPVWSGSFHEMMSGYAQNPYSYAYFTLFTANNDGGPERAYLPVRYGMKLSWYQYNYQQSTMSLDLVMSDGTTLRDSGITDQNRVRIHPAYRGGYATGRWHYFEVDLTPLQGKTISHWLIAYDNGGNGVLGQFRAYFDNVQVHY